MLNSSFEGEKGGGGSVYLKMKNYLMYFFIYFSLIYMS